jgi:outer membrane protein
MLKKRVYPPVFVFAVLLSSLFFSNYRAVASEPVHHGTAAGDVTDPESSLHLDLNTCIDIAFENNRLRSVSELAVRMAELQYKQALSSYWPSFFINASVTRFDDTPDYTFSGAGFNGMTVDLMDNELWVTSLDLSFPIYTGGRRPALTRKAKLGIDISQEDARRTDLKILHDIKRVYFSVILTQKLREIGRDILTHFEAVQQLTEGFFTSGSLRVDKCDYLRSKTLTEGVRAYVSTLDSNVELAQASLVNILGLAYDTRIIISENTIPFQPVTTNLADLVGEAYVFNPDWKKMGAQLKALELTVDEKKSGHLPTFFLGGRLYTLDPSKKGGLITDNNTDGYSIAIYMQLPVFKGFQTKNEVREARLGFDAAKEQTLILKEGIGLQVRHALILLNRYADEVQQTHEAVMTAEENTRLALRAFQSNLMELDKVTENLILEAFMKITHETALYNHLEAQANLDFIIGKKVRQLVGGDT